MKRILVIGLLLAACGGSPARSEVLVSAASSLTDVFGEIEQAYEAAHPGVDVVLNLGASSTLAAQIVEGAPVDVFAAADGLTMRDVVDAGLADDEPVTFARNRIVIAVPAGNPGGLQGIDDFERAELLLGICAAGAPCGTLAGEAFAAAGIDAEIDTEEPNVRALLAKVVSGELDAGIVYATDAAGSAVQALPIEPPVTTGYPIVAVADGSGSAVDFIGFVLSDEGQAILLRYGFEAP